MTRRTGEQTRELLIRTAMTMLLDRGVSAGVSHIRLQEVVRRAGLTTGAAYRLWADQEDFHRDLAVAVAKWRKDSPISNTWNAIGSTLGPGTTMADVARIGADRYVRSFGGPDGDTSPPARLFMLALALRATAQTWDCLRDASYERHDQSVREFSSLYRNLMDALGYRMRAPYTVEQFAVAMAALGEGFALQAIEGIDHPRLVVGDDDEAPAGSWTLLGISVLGLINAFMVEVEPAAALAPHTTDLAAELLREPAEV